MNPMLVVFGGFVLAIVLIVLAAGLWHPRSGVDIVGRSLRDDGAEAEIEAHDIDQMLDAREERRRRAGRRPIADELARQLEPHLRDG